MIEKVASVRNPLTVIAMFAALAEVGGTVVLPILAESVQKTYVWFLMIFPLVLVIAFFTVLYLKPHVLYAPSDYKSDDGFLQLIRPQSPLERVEEIAKAVESEATFRQTPPSPLAPPLPLAPIARPSSAVAPTTPNADENAEVDVAVSQIGRQEKVGQVMANAVLAEELVMAKLEKDNKWKIARNVVAHGKNSDLTFDGVTHDGHTSFGISVIYSRSIASAEFRAKSRIEQVRDFVGRMDSSMRMGFKAMIVVVTDDEPDLEWSAFLMRIDAVAERQPMPVDVQIWDLESLKLEFGRR